MCPVRSSHEAEDRYGVRTSSMCPVRSSHEAEDRYGRPVCVQYVHHMKLKTGMEYVRPVRPMRVDQVDAETCALRRTSRVGPWANPFPAIHGGLDTAD